MNVEFSASHCEDFIKSLNRDGEYEFLRKIAFEKGVPSLEEAACLALTNMVSIKKPENGADIGCGIGISSLAILKGWPGIRLTALDGNLERLLVFNSYFKSFPNVKSYQIRGEQWLSACEESYDFAFIDSVKREYGEMWRRLRPRLNPGALAIFDDVLLYGYVSCEEAETPIKYRRNRREMINFLQCIFSDKTLSAQIIPVSGGLLAVSLKS